MLDLLMDFIRTDPRGEVYRNLDWSHEYDLARNGDPTDTQSASNRRFRAVDNVNAWLCKQSWRE